MKNILSLSLLFCLSMVFGQNISDYQYIYVPAKFKDFEANQYNLNTQLKKALIDKKYTIIHEEMTDWPAELRENPCKVLTADLLNDSNMFRNRVKLQFTNCQKKVVSETKGNSLYKEYDLGFEDALNLSLKTIPTSSPNPNLFVADLKSSIKEEIPRPIDLKEVKEIKNEEPVSTPPVPTKSVESKSVESKKAESYTNGKVNLQKVQISKDQFILVSSSSSVPFATFKNTTKADVYRVTLENGTSTLGYTENGNLVIEIPTSDGDFKKEVFMAK